MEEQERLNENGVGLAKDMGVCGYASKFVKAIHSPLGDTYYFDLENPLQYNQRGLKSAVEKLSVAHRIDMTFKTTKEAHYSIFVNENEASCNAVVVGKDEQGKLVLFDFSHIPHLLIAGTTGSGKSVLLHNLLVNLLALRSERPREFVIIDPKGSEFKNYKGVNNIHFCDETAQAIEWLACVENEMDKRYKLPDPMSKHDIFVVIDELADLMLTSKYAVEQSIVRIAQKGRACGIHLIVATQRPTINVISGLIKANMPYRIGLKTASVRDSVVIIDHKGLEQLRGFGDSIVKFGLQEYHTQIAYPELELEEHYIKINRG